MNFYQYKNLRIEVIDESIYAIEPTDNSFNYSKQYFGEAGTDHSVSRYGIKVYQNNEIIDSCVIVASGGASEIRETSLLIDNEKLMICCGDSVFCLSLPELNLDWNVQADMATCFQIFRLEEDYLVHGELEITRLDKDGKIKWQFRGKDIFVTKDVDATACVIEDDYILLKDFYGLEYKLNFEGEEV